MNVWVTGGAGFIGSQLIEKLNSLGEDKIIVIDDLTDGEKFKNLKNCTFSRYYDFEEFSKVLKEGNINPPKLIFHQGAISDTTVRNGKIMFEQNYSFSINLLEYALSNCIPFIYASSASVYGLNHKSVEIKTFEDPINVYAYSKLAFDNYVRSKIRKNSSQIVGLRYFNVYGPGEFHKGKMASTILQFHHQFLEEKKIKLFGSYLKFKNGEQSRDFIYVEDVIKTNLWFSQNSNISGIFNVGTGNSRTFNEVAKEVIRNNFPKKKVVYNDDREFLKYIDYVEFPSHLKGRYQSYTNADLTNLRKVGFEYTFLSIEEGIEMYIKKLRTI